MTRINLVPRTSILLLVVILFGLVLILFASQLVSAVGGIIISDPTARFDEARDVATDLDFLYVVGKCADGCGSAGLDAWRIEKRNKTDGSLVTAFGNNGAVVSDPTTKSDTSNAIVADDLHLYVVGQSGGSWRIEKINKSDGALVTSFDGDGVVISNPTKGFDEITAVAVDDNFLYAAGQCANRCGKLGGVAWRIEKRDKISGALVTSFNGDGVIVSDPTKLADRPHALVIDNSYLYVVGDCYGCGTSGGFAWRIEKRNKVDGSLTAGFGRAGVLVSDPTGNEDIALDATLDSAALYVAGYCGSCGGSGSYAWRIEKRNLLDGSLVTVFDGDGAVVSDPTVGGDKPFAVIVDGSALYAAGYCDGCGLTGQRAWYIEKRDLVSGSLAQ